MKVGERHSKLEKLNNAVEILESQRRLGEFLRSLRNSKKGGSLRAVGDAIGISHNYLSRIELGSERPEDEVLKKLADFYEVDEFKLFEIGSRIPYTIRKSLENDERLREVVYKLADDKSFLDKIYGLL